MRIFHLIPNLSGGGAERQLSYLAPLLVNMGHEVHIGYYNNGPNPIYLPGVILHKLKSSSNYDPFVIWQLIILIRKIKPDIVQTWILQMDILGGFAALINRIPWVLREPTSKPYYLSTLKNKIRFYLGIMSNGIISNSIGGDECWSQRVPISKRFIIKNGIPITEIEAINPTLHHDFLPENKKIVLYVGRFVPNKNLKYLIAAFAKVKQSSDFIAIFCGDGPQRLELEILVKERELQNHIIFTGYLSATSVWELMKISSMFISLSAYEGCPNSVMEAMVCGVPLVLSDIPAHHELLGDDCALFVNPSDSNQTANSILNILNDEKCSKKISNNAKKNTLDFSINNMSQKYEQVYKSLLSK